MKEDGNVYIKKVYIRNFRRFNNDGTTFLFQPDINIIIGENNCGKSSLVDALRLAMASGTYRKNLYVDVSDFHINVFGERENEIEIDIYFEGLSQEQSATFYQLIDGEDSQKAELHLKYTIYRDSKGNEKVRDSIFGGVRNNSVDREIFDSLNLVFMPALRDAEKDLRPARASQLAQLLYTFAPSKEDRERIVQALVDANDQILQDISLQSLQNSINDNLQSIEKEELSQQVNVSLSPPTFDSIAGNLNAWYVMSHRKVKMKKSQWEALCLKHDADFKKDRFGLYEIDNETIAIDTDELKQSGENVDLVAEIAKLTSQSSITIKQNGLGYNNILSMASALDLQRTLAEDEYTVFLVEEPEAHLHPQLLDLIFSFFRKSIVDNNVQMFLTSHSPTLVSKAEIDSLSIVYQMNDAIEVSPISECRLTAIEKDDLSRYLDVTKSQMFFAKRVIFVEGISEALLLLEFANLLGMPLDKYSVEVVNIDGIAFDAFARLYSTNENQTNLKHPCVIITDDDRCTMANDPNRIDSKELVFSSLDVESIRSRLLAGNQSSRAVNLTLFANDNLEVKLANKTLEYELASIEENQPLLLEILGTLHPVIHREILVKIESGLPCDRIAILIWVAIKDCKGIFAQRLSREISSIALGKRTDVSFTVPEYIKEALEFIIEK